MAHRIVPVQLFFSSAEKEGGSSSLKLFNQPRRQCPDQPKQTQSMALTENKSHLLIFTVEKNTHTKQKSEQRNRQKKQKTTTTGGDVGFECSLF